MFTVLISTEPSCVIPNHYKSNALWRNTIQMTRVVYAHPYLVHPIVFECEAFRPILSWPDIFQSSIFQILSRYNLNMTFQCYSLSWCWWIRRVHCALFIQTHWIWKARRLPVHSMLFARLWYNMQFTYSNTCVSERIEVPPRSSSVRYKDWTIILCGRSLLNTKKSKEGLCSIFAIIVFDLNTL